VSLFPPNLYSGGGGFCTGSYEGRVGVHFEPSLKPGGGAGVDKWGESFHFKCHRPKAEGGAKERVYAVNAVAFHPVRTSLLLTAGADGEATLWDIRKRTRVATLVESLPAGLGIPSVSFNPAGTLLAFARSDDWTGGEARHLALAAAGHKSQVCVAPVPAA